MQPTDAEPALGLEFRYGGPYEDNNSRNESGRLPGSEAHRGGGRVAQQQPSSRREFDLSPVEEERARGVPGESSHADLRGRSLLSRPAINPWRGRRSGDHHPTGEHGAD